MSKKNNDMKNAGELIDVVRSVTRQEMADKDTTVVCEVQSVNDDSTLNLFVLPDRQTAITNIINQCRFDFNTGDMALLYKIENRLSNSFVIAKYNAKSTDTPLAKSGVVNKVNNITQNQQRANENANREISDLQKNQSVIYGELDRRIVDSGNYLHTVYIKGKSRDSESPSSNTFCAMLTCYSKDKQRITTIETLKIALTKTAYSIYRRVDTLPCSGFVGSSLIMKTKILYSTRWEQDCLYLYPTVGTSINVDLSPVQNLHIEDYVCVC